MERFRIQYEVDAETREEVLKLFSGMGFEPKVESLGYVHPDGIVRECNLPPEGLSLRELVSDYYGSHDELGEGTFSIWVAVPKGSRKPKIRLSHGHMRKDWEGLAKLPKGSLVWSGEWRFVSDTLADVELISNVSRH